MTQVHFTLNQEEIQNLLEESVSGELSKNILTRIFNQLMVQQWDRYIVVGDNEGDDTTRIGTLALRFPRIHEGNLSPDTLECS